MSAADQKITAADDTALYTEKTGISSLQTALYTVIFATMAITFAVDFYSALGVATWIFYLIPIVLCLLLWRPSAPIWTALLVTGLMGITFFTDSSGVNRHVAQLNRTFGVLTIWTVAIVGYFFIRNKLAVWREEWFRGGLTGLSLAMRGESSLSQLGSIILKHLTDYTSAQVGAVYIRQEGVFRRVATFGVPADGALPTFGQDDGFLAQAVKDNRLYFLDDVPESYLKLGSALGQTKPRYLAIAPAAASDDVNAVIELGFNQRANILKLEMLRRFSEAIGAAVNTANYIAVQKRLLEETQRQSEELQTQSEELRVANEELEEQSRALQESQARLEQQQAELEQTNSQLEEQTQMLEVQRDDLAAAQADLKARSAELEQASQYKSDFLANMSHELRTPLNSSLILAKLMADNPDGNLTDEQVRYAQTIEASGNDLLALINDILDLSKIESGHMEIQVEKLPVQTIVNSIARGIEPLTQQKSLSFKTEIADNCPKYISTDQKRLEQILKNLLSNAVKFTEKGSVTLGLRCGTDGRVSFDVIDTGIGVPQDKHDVIFEAFRQADGTTNRRFGGTGLGLSISRELARLLGGDISLSSTPGKGSTFTVTLPEAYDQQLVRPRSAPATPPAPAPKSDSQKKIAARPGIDDDRENLKSNGRIILVVEDDLSFAEILSDLAHQQDFQCLITDTADEALQLAIQYLPSAVLLDVGLPDHSGLSVLDRLKQDARTRHIPVHVISAHDHAETALSLGAAGYVLKPTKREELLGVFRQLESKLVQQVRRVLVVEDDPVQRESVQKLLAGKDVEIEGAGTAAECLTLLKEKSYDCMVLDLSLPDASGYSLLETLSKEDSYSFPPVIVYTGHDLSQADEQKLRRYSKSIIIKGAKSPERLLDEVTLFLHQVVADLPPEQQKLLKKAKNRDAVLEGRRILVVEDDIRNVYAVTSIFEPRGAIVQIARNGIEGLKALEAAKNDPSRKIDLVLMDVMMPEMDGLVATREIRKRPEWKKLPVIMLTAKAMKDDQMNCLAAGANDYMPKPIDVEKLLSLVRVWMPR